MNPELFVTIVLPLALIVFVLVGVVYFLLRKTEETTYEKQMKGLRKSLFKGEIDRRTFLYISDNMKAENHFSEESQRMDKMFENKKIDSTTYLRIKKILENNYNERLVMIQKNYDEIAKRSKKDFQLYLQNVLDQDYPKVKYEKPDNWVFNKETKKSTD